MNVIYTETIAGFISHYIASFIMPRSDFISIYLFSFWVSLFVVLLYLGVKIFFIFYE